MNLFEPNIDDFSFVLSEIGKDIKIKGNSARALITSINFNENYFVDDKYITTLEESYTLGMKLNLKGINGLSYLLEKAKMLNIKGL